MTSQTERIVIGYDGSDHSSTALDWAAAEAERHGLPLTVLSVYDQVTMVPGPFSASVWPASFKAEAVEIAEEGAQRARKAADSIDVTAATMNSQAAYGLIESSRNATLLVVGTRGHGEVAGALLGSVAFAVSAHAHCPVVVVRGDAGQLPGPDRPVLVGVDGSTGSEAAVRFAADTASAGGATLIVVTVYRSSWTPLGDEPVRTLEADGVASFDSLIRSAAAKQAKAAARVAHDAHPDLPVQERVLEGRPADIMALAAKGAGLIVVGSRGHGGFAGLMLGSVSHAVIHSAPCPVAVVRTPSTPNPA